MCKCYVTLAGTPSLTLGTKVKKRYGFYLLWNPQSRPMALASDCVRSRECGEGLIKLCQVVCVFFFFFSGPFFRNSVGLEGLGLFWARHTKLLIPETVPYWKYFYIFMTKIIRNLELLKLHHCQMNAIKAFIQKE